MKIKQKFHRCRYMMQHIRAYYNVDSFTTKWYICCIETEIDPWLWIYFCHNDISFDELR
jgi:hypothetical protein